MSQYRPRVGIFLLSKESQDIKIPDFEYKMADVSHVWVSAVLNDLHTLRLCDFAVLYIYCDDLTVSQSIFFGLCMKHCMKIVVILRGHGDSLNQIREICDSNLIPIISSDEQLQDAIKDRLVSEDV